ncbi:hypothetical protein J6590_082289 [Homalodisca vitripennis]|nr:hypothetical protein J6590_082289 [Homalodisca vitripennis]
MSTLRCPNHPPAATRRVYRLLSAYSFPSTWKIYNQRRVPIMSTLRCPPSPGSDKARVQVTDQRRVTIMSTLRCPNHPPAAKRLVHRLLSAYSPIYMENIQPKEGHHNVNIEMP